MSNPTISARNCLIYWTPLWNDRTTAGKVFVTCLGDTKRDKEFLMVGGAAYTEWRTCGLEELVSRLLVEFNSIIIRDRIDPFVVHEAFLQIEEYRNSIAQDCPGLE